MKSPHSAQYQIRMPKGEFDGEKKSEAANNLDSELGLTPMTSLGVVSDGVSGS